MNEIHKFVIFQTKVGLIINVVKVLGFGKAMEILEETKKIERRGGIPTADRKRRYAIISLNTLGHEGPHFKVR